MFTQSFIVVRPSLFLSLVHHAPIKLRMETDTEPAKVESLAFSSENTPTPDGELASEDEIRDLRHVADTLPARVWLAALIGMAERFGYYGIQSVFREWYFKSRRTESFLVGKC